MRWSRACNPCAPQVRGNLEFELLCGREELSAVRQRARQMVHDKDEELEVCRKLLQKEVEGQKQAANPNPNPDPNPNPNPNPNSHPNPNPHPEQAAEAEAAITMSDKRAAEAAAEAAGPGLGGADASVVYSARLQSHRDVEVLRLQRECETLQARRNGGLYVTCYLPLSDEGLFTAYHPLTTDRLPLTTAG